MAERCKMRPDKGKMWGEYREGSVNLRQSEKQRCSLLFLYYVCH